MAATPLHLLWGPPGTGKTTTMGAAVAGWLRQGKRVLVVSTSNAAVDVAMRSVLKRVEPDEKRALLRLGTSLDPEVGKLTLEGKLAEPERTLARASPRPRSGSPQINEIISTKSPSTAQLHAYFGSWPSARARPAVQRQAERESAQLLAERPGDGLHPGPDGPRQNLRTKRFDVVVAGRGVDGLAALRPGGIDAGRVASGLRR